MKQSLTALIATMPLAFASCVSPQTSVLATYTPLGQTYDFNGDRVPDTMIAECRRSNNPDPLARYEVSFSYWDSTTNKRTPLPIQHVFFTNVPRAMKGDLFTLRDSDSNYMLMLCTETIAQEIPTDIPTQATVSH